MQHPSREPHIPPSRLAFVGGQSVLCEPLVRGLWTRFFQHDAHHQLRLVTSWGNGSHAMLKGQLRVERASYQPGHASSLELALRACNFVVYIIEPEHLSTPQLVQELRDLAKICRETEVERLVVVSCGSMLSGQVGVSLYDEAGLPPLVGAEVSPFLSSRIAAELELFRFAAEGLNLVTLYPSLVWRPEDARFRAALAQAPTHTEVSVLSTSQLVLAVWRALVLGKAGRRFALSECVASVDELTPHMAGAQRKKRHMSHVPSRFLDPLSRSVTLNSSASRQVLGLSAVSDIQALRLMHGEENT